jgi:hypothetical protein
MLTFVQEHETILQTILAATANAIADAPESHYRAVKISTESIERVFPQVRVVEWMGLLFRYLI